MILFSNYLWLQCLTGVPLRSYIGPFEFRLYSTLVVLIKDKVYAGKRAHFMHKNEPNDLYFSVNHQVNDDMKAHFGGSTHFMANIIQTSSKGGVAKYHYQLLGSPTPWPMMNTLKRHPAE